MRLLVVAWIVLPLLVVVAPQGAAQEGCTPCECGVAYCEDGVTHWPVIEWVEVPDTVVFGETFEVAWRFTFDPPRENRTPITAWAGGQAFLGIANEHPGTEPAHRPDGHARHVNSSAPIVFPGEHRVNVTLVGYDEHWLVAASDIPQVNSTPARVVVMPHADPRPGGNGSSDTLTPQGPTERTDGVPALGLWLLVPLVIVAARR